MSFAARHCIHRAVRPSSLSWLSPSSLSTRTPARLFHATAANMTVHEFTSKADFTAAIKDHKVVIIDASATWCGPCKVIGPIFAKLSEEASNGSVYFAKFDVDNVADLAQELGVRAMPTFAVFVDGEQKDSLLGGHPQKLKELVTKYATASA